MVSIIKPLTPQRSSIKDMCIDAVNNRLFVCAGAEVWVYDTITLTRTNVITGFHSTNLIRVDPNLTNNRIMVYDFGDDSIFRFIDRKTLILNNNTVSIGYLSGGFEFDQVTERNQVLVISSQNSIGILDTTNFALKQQIIDPQFQGLGKVKRNAHNLDELYIFSNGGTNVIVFNMGDFSYTIKSFSGGVFDADSDPNLPNNRIYTASFGASAAYTASDFGYIQNLNLPAAATVVVADPVLSNHRLFFGGVDLLYSVTLG